MLAALRTAVLFSDQLDPFTYGSFDLHPVDRVTAEIVENRLNVVVVEYLHPEFGYPEINRFPGQAFFESNGQGGDEVDVLCLGNGVAIDSRTF